jgi:hypothetical protein
MMKSDAFTKCARCDDIFHQGIIDQIHAAAFRTLVKFIIRSLMENGIITNFPSATGITDGLALLYRAE